jgi:hypothetical protein
MGEGLLYDTGFTYRFDRLKPGASKFRGHLAKVYKYFNTVIGLSHLCSRRRIARYLLSAMYTQEKFEDTKEVLWSQCGI